MRLDWLTAAQLSAFKRVADAGSITAAAKHGATQASLREQLRTLEDRLGVRLFRRHPGGVDLTEPGRRFLEVVDGILADLNTLAAAPLPDTTLPRERVSIGMPPIIARVLSARLVLRCADLRPDILIQITEGYSWDVHESLEAGDMDFGLFYEGASTRNPFSEVAFRERLSLVAQPDKIAALPGRLSRARILQLPLIVPCSPHGNRAMIERLATEENISLKPSQETVSLQSMIDLAEAGLGFALLPATVVGRQLAQARLAATDDFDPPIVRQLMMATSTRREASEGARAVMTIVRDLLRQMTSDAEPHGGPSALD